MSGPVASTVILPDDSGNAGKKIRTQTKSVGGNDVHEHFFVRSRQAVLLGVYAHGMDQVTAAQSAQNGTSTGCLWFHVPTAISNKQARVRRVTLSSQHSTVLATPTAPRLMFSRFTFSGTASGGSMTAVKLDTGYPAAVADLRSAVTGLTVSLVGPLATAPYCGALTAVGGYAPNYMELIHPGDEDNWWTFDPGEGFVAWQDTAGTSSDTRKMNFNLVWDEIDLS